MSEHFPGVGGCSWAVGNIWEELTAELTPRTVQVVNISDVWHWEIQTSAFSIIVGCCRGSGNISVQGIEVLRLRAVHIEPPVTDEVLLVEEGPVRAEEAVLYQGATAIIPTDVESLAVCVLISIVTLYLLVTVEPSIGGSDENLVKNISVLKWKIYQYWNEK